ncbi:MAG: tetratricopeptide repeat protein [Vicinamibacterales bacterium]
MARNPVTRRPRPAAKDARPPQPSPVVPAMLLVGAVLAVAVPWMARSSAPHRALAPPAALQLLVPSPPRGEPAAPAPVAEAQRIEPRAFMDDRSSGAVAYASGNYAGALTSYRDAVARHPADSEAHSNLGQVLVRLGQPAEALPHFDRAIELIPGRWAYHFNRARALRLLGRLDESVVAYQTAQQLFPDDYATAFNLGQTLHAKGDEPSAVREYLKAIALNPDDGSFRLALGISLEKLQRRAEAAAAYGEYLRLSPEAPDGERVRARIAQLTTPAS